MARNPGSAKEFPQLPGLKPEAFPDPATATKFNSGLAAYYQQLNGRISVGTPESLEGFSSAWSGHLDGELVWVTTTAQNADFAVAHGLERVPLGWITLSPESPEPLHRLSSTPANTSSFLWVRSAAAVGTRYLILVV